MCLLLSFLLSFFLLFPSPPSAFPADRICQDTGVDLSHAIILESSDSHGGFLGDGTTYVKLLVPHTVFDSREPSFFWKPFPLTDNIHSALYGGHRFCLFLDENGAPLLPVIENGYYLFEDRHDQSTDAADDKNLYSRSSWNFTLSVYDLDNETLYYLRFDT